MLDDAEVKGVSDTTANTVATVDIVREITEEKKVDKDLLNQDETEKVIQKVLDQKQDVVQIVVDDIPEDKADEVTITINKAAVKELSGSKVALEVKTEDVSIQVAKLSLQGISNNEQDLYFRVIPIKDEAQQTEAIQNAITAGVVQQAAEGSEVVSLGTPMTIETNYQGFSTKIIFSLKDIKIPEDEVLRKEFLNSLGVYINHSDGEQEYNRGTIKYDEKGNPVGIEIEINKFSSFTIVSIKNAKPVAADLAIKGKPVVGNKLKVSYTYTDINKDEQGNSIIVWYKADSKTGKNKKLLAEDKLTYKIGKADQGKYIIVEVTPIAVSGESTGSTVSKYVKVASVNEAPKVVLAKLKGKTVVGSKLTLSYTYKDAEQDIEEKTTIQWYRADSADGTNKQKIKSTNRLTYTLKKADAGKYIIAEIKPVAKTGNKDGAKVTAVTKTSVNKPTVIETEITYSCHVKLGLISSKTYAEKVKKLFKQNYRNVNAEVRKEGTYYRIYLDFINLKEAQTVCNDMKEKKYIVNYYFYTK